VNEYYAMMSEAAAAHTTEEWMALGAANSIPVMRANLPADIFEDEQLSKTLFETRQLEGEGDYRAIKPGLQFSKTPASIRRDPPRIGQDTDEVLAEIGYPAAKA
ncbi:MAG: CoA transferase, partial [Caulobacteraceae bacterium]|nr:CoA transferase [Caulobacteraceae bacterium]